MLMHRVYSQAFGYAIWLFFIYKTKTTSHILPCIAHGELVRCILGPGGSSSEEGSVLWEALGSMPVLVPVR